MACPCLKCDPSGERFRSWFGRYPWEEEKRRRTREEVVLARRERQRILEMKREARARYYASRKRRAPLPEPQAV